jgi:hypothetical protein
VNYFIIFISLIFISIESRAQLSSRVREYQSTYLLSTGGAGAASFVGETSAILNPATLGVQEVSTMYYQDMDSKIDNENATRTASGPAYSPVSASRALIISDTTTPVKGSFGYFSQRENDAKRRRLTFTMAMPAGPSTAVGLTWRYNRLFTNFSSSYQKDIYQQLVIGTYHRITPNFTSGIVITDIFKAKQDEGKIQVGFRYDLAMKLSFLVDFGGNFNRELSETAFSSVAMQLNFFSQLYIRISSFSDKLLGVKGTGWGMNWQGPKMNLEFAMKSTKQSDTNSILLYADETIQDASFAVSIAF